MKIHCLKTAFPVALALAFLALVHSQAATAETILGDIQQDWSFTNNPNVGTNGTWSFNQGNTPLIQVINNVGDPAAQFNGWGPANVPGDLLPLWATMTAGGVAEGFDAAIGNVVVHSTDPFNGAGNGPANATWTSAYTGRVTISGDLWAPSTHFPTRLNDYELSLIHGPSQSVLASGKILMDGSNSSINPIAFSFTGQSISAGDIVKLLVTEDPSSPAGFFTAVDLTISADSSDAPEPASLFELVGFGAVIGVAATCRRLRRAHVRSQSVPRTEY